MSRGVRQVLMPAEILFAWRDKDWIRSILLVHATLPHMFTLLCAAH